MTTMLDEPTEGAAEAPRQSRLKALMHLELTKGRVKRKDLMHFSRQMAVFVKAGIPIIEALDSITEEVTNKHLKAVLTAMAEDLRSGHTFTGAADRHPDVFPSFYRGMLGSAELTGRLDQVLLQLSEYMERDLEARRKISSALVYPAVVLSLSLVTVIILVTFVLPRFKDFFQSLHAKLPLPTRILLGFANFLEHWWWIFAGAIVISALCLVITARQEEGRALRDKLILKVPALGDVIRHAILERFCRVLSAMVGAGVPLPDALAVTTGATNNAVFERGLVTARESMMRGEGLAGPLAASGLFPGAARQMFRVGENTGTLDEQLEVAADYFERELDYKIKRFTSLFEPAVIIFVGVVVGFVAVALVSAMYGIFRSANV